jgi:hypothetical protein
MYIGLSKGASAILLEMVLIWAGLNPTAEMAVKNKNQNKKDKK